MNYPSIRIEGAILSPDLIDRLEDLPGQRPADFSLESGVKVKDEIARAWADAQDYWRIFRRKLETLRPDAPATTETRNLWIVPLLGLLKHDLEFQKAGADINGRIYAISHRAVNRAQMPVQILGYADPAGLDRKPANATLRMSAHALVQEYLNLAEQLYGIVTNGRVLRLLRDSSRLVRQTFVEFDLERIFTDGLFADFAVLYRLLHATRFPTAGQGWAESLVERYHQDSIDSGARIREGLSKAVEQAILTFGNGFLAHPANVRLRERIADGSLTPDAFYKSLLRLIYRLLFLMVIEERDLVHPPSATARQRETYHRWYSLQRLRTLSEKRFLADTRHDDLWLGLVSTFRLFDAGGPGAKLGLKPLAGDLFGEGAIGELEDASLSNANLLNCLRSLGLYEHPDNRQLIRVNYAALNVEEFGSVYEGLLEYEPFIDTSGTTPVFRFKAGDERAATGSHYTPDDLVQPLIKHSLDYLIADRLKAKDQAAALLDLRVADIACGSGHILLAAARRIATELAIVRTGEEQPSPAAFRAAIRDVIRTCIYGVDYNPLAVELCKVALWLEAHNPGEPLNFLDHHIKCGNAIVGFVKREEVDAGIPDEAFAKLPGDDPDVGKEIRARNKRERKERSTRQGTLDFTTDRENDINAVLARWRTVTAMPETTPAEIDAKKRAFEAFTTSGAAHVLRQIASIPIAQFYIERTKANEHKLITDEQFREYWSGRRTPQGPAPAAAFAVANRKRFFHWFLELPEIVERGGFDCILGNPPYLGDKKLRARYGAEFLQVMKYLFPLAGANDLAVYFVQRIGRLLAPTGRCGLLTTSSIAEGDLASGGLGVLSEANYRIDFASPRLTWPGQASVTVVQLSFSAPKATLVPTRRGNVVVDRLGPSLLEESVSDAATALRENDDRCFTGYYWLGDGFLLPSPVARQMLDVDPANSDVIQLFVNGDDLNSNPTQNAGKYIINFGDRSQTEASAYSLPFKHLEATVKPVRALAARKSCRDRWWIYAESRPGLRVAIAALAKCLVLSQTSKHFAVSIGSTAVAFGQSVFVIATERTEILGVIQSCFHETWRMRYGRNIGDTPRYAPTTCFAPFPFPQNSWLGSQLQLSRPAETYHTHRRGLMLSLWLGLTDIYNLFHSRELEADLKAHFAARAKKDPSGLAIPAEHRERAVAFTYEHALAGLLEFRRLHVALDEAVLHAYGWDAGGANNGTAGPITLAHDFYEVETLPENDRLRYTISPAARKEVLKRLLALNHKRANEEEKTLPAKGAKKAKPRDDDEPPAPGLFAAGRA